jgi:hypothetical protein
VTDEWGGASDLIPFLPDPPDPCPAFLRTITGLADSAFFPLTRLLSSLEPINLGDQHEFSLPEFSIPLTDCTAAADFELDLGAITGLGASDIGVELLEGEDSHCDLSLTDAGSFDATWRLQMTLENLHVEASAKIDSEACGQGFDGQAVGSVALPHAKLTIDFQASGSTEGLGAWPLAQLDTFELTEIDLEMASIFLSANITSTLGNADMAHEVNVTDWIEGDVAQSLSAQISSFFNDNIGALLPLSLPP